MNSLRLAWTEIKRLSRSRFLRIALVAVSLMPLLYSFLYLYAFWDPYGRLDHLPVALVVQDTGATRDGKVENFGQQLAEKLVANKTVQWETVTEAVAEDGLNSGHYYLALYVPADFSAKVLTATTAQPEKAELVYVTNQGASYLASSIGGKLMSEVRAQIAGELSGQFFETTLVGLKDGAEGLKAAADGARQLTDGVTDAAKGAGAVQSGATQLRDGAVQLATGATAARQGADQLAAGVATAGARLTAAGQGAAQLKGGIDSATQASQKLAGGADQLNTGLTQLQQQLTTNLPALSGGLSAAQQALEAYVAANPAAAQDPAFRQALGAVGQVNTGLTQLNTGTAGALTQLTAGAGALKSGTAAMQTGLTQLQTGSDQLAAGLSDPGGMQQLEQGARSLATALGQLESGSARLQGGLAGLQSGASQLSGGLGRLQEGSQTLTAKLADASTDMAAQATGDAAERGQVLGNPVTLAEKDLFEVKAYGTGFAPYFIPLSLWVGAMVLFFVIRTKENRLKTSPVSPAMQVLAKFWTLAGFGTVQALITSWVIHVGLGLHVQSVWQFYAFNVLLSWTFIAIMQLLVGLMGMVGRFLAMVIMMLQLTSCAGTFPAELLPRFFQVLNPYFPMTYGTAGLRRIIAGSSTVGLGTCLTVLATFLVGALALTMLTESRFVSMRDLHPSQELAA